MGREVRMVPVDFDWPLNEVWPGFLLPDKLRLPVCPDCDGRGLSLVARQMEHTWYGMYASNEELTRWDDKLVQSDVDALWGAGRLSAYFGEKPTAGVVNEWQRERGTWGHDAISRHIVIRHRCELLGVDDTCARCGGDGRDATPEQRAAEEAWEPTDPPEGDGWQLWETVSEGSPISPVFPDREGLIGWLCSPAYTWGASAPLSRAQAERFVDAGWAPTWAVVDGRSVPGDQL